MPMLNPFCHSKVDRAYVHSKKGSIILETVIVVPVFLLIGTFLLTVISCVRAEILFAQAVDQVTQEISVAVPIAGAGLDLAEQALVFINKNSSGSSDEAQTNNNSSAKNILVTAISGVGALLESLGIQSQDVLGTLILGQAIGSRIEAMFASYYPAESILHTRIKNVSVYVDYDKENNVIWLRVYYQWQTLFGTRDRMIQSAVPIFGDLDFSLPGAEDTGAKDKIWLLTNFERGDTLRSVFGGGLPKTYPVIASWNNGTATSIKSLDLTAPSYQITGNITEKIKEFIDELANFNGTDSPWGKDGIWIKSEQIHSKVLIIVIPENISPEALEELTACISYANIHGIQLKIEKYGNSHKYDSPTAEETPSE